MTDRRFDVAGVTSATPLADAAPAILRAKAGPLFALEAAARSGADADAVHDMRVASRRLREAMRLFEPLYPGRAFRFWYRQIRRITRALGPVRDSDVLIAHFAGLAPSLGESGRRATAFLVGYRYGQRTAELARLNGELAHLDLDRKRRDFESMAGSPAASVTAGVTLGGFAHAAVAARAAIVFGAQPAALSEANIAEQHALRIDYKRLRYAVEAFAPCYGADFAALHAALTAFQDSLGDLHDIHVFLDVVRDPALGAAGARAGVAAADFAEVEAVLTRRAHDAFARFSLLVDKHPAEVLLPALLLPLSRVPETAPGSGPDEEAAQAEPYAIPATVEGADSDGIAGAIEELPFASPVIVGDEPWVAAWDEGETTVTADASLLPDDDATGSG